MLNCHGANYDPESVEHQLHRLGIGDVITRNGPDHRFIIERES